MSVILAYYLDNKIDVIEEILSEIPKFLVNKTDIYEVLSGYEAKTAANFIASTLIEVGIGVPVIHDKYDFCHGRTTLGHSFNSSLIFFDTGSELDRLYNELLKDYYNDLIILKKKYEDNIVNDYYFTYLSMFLCREIALLKNKDLSLVDYSPLVKKLYYFKGGM